MYIRLNDPELLGTLIESLVAARCSAVAVDDRTCRVELPDAVDAQQATVEMRFFVRAWQSRHGDADAYLYS
jgi:hypothetical protein